MTARRMSELLSLRQRAASWPSRVCCVGVRSVAKGRDCDFRGDDGEEVDVDELDDDGDSNGLVGEVAQTRWSRPAST